MASLELFGLDYRRVALLKKILISSLEHLSEEEKVIVEELIEFCKNRQKQSSESILQGINQVTSGFSENQRLFVIDAFFHGLTPFFDPHPVVVLASSQVFKTKAVYQSTDTRDGFRLDCVE